MSKIKKDVQQKKVYCKILYPVYTAAIERKAKYSQRIKMCKGFCYFLYSIYFKRLLKKSAALLQYLLAIVKKTDLPITIFTCHC